MKKVLLQTLASLILGVFFLPTAFADFCELNGVRVPENESHLFYLADNVPYRKTCDSIAQYRPCVCSSPGSCGFTGSSVYDEPYCYTELPDDCSLDSVSVPHGDTALFYESSEVVDIADCVSESRACFNGVLSGSYAFGTCVSPTDKCAAPEGGLIDDGANVTYFEDSYVPYGSTCVSESRSCSSGVLSGSFENVTCEVLANPYDIAPVDTDDDLIEPTIDSSAFFRSFIDSYNFLVNVVANPDYLPYMGYYVFMLAFGLFVMFVIYGIFQMIIGI